MKQLKNQRGLTLIELLAVIVILAIIAAIAAVAIGNVIQNSKDKGALSDAVAVINGAKIAHMDGYCEAGDSCDNLADGGFVESSIEDADTATVTVNNDDGKITYSVAWDRISNDNIKNPKYQVDGDATEEELLKKLNGSD